MSPLRTLVRGVAFALALAASCVFAQAVKPHGDEIFTQSRDLKPLDRYFPELGEPFREQLPERCVLDGEVVIAQDGALAFESLLLRIHPAESRVRMLAAETGRSASRCSEVTAPFHSCGDHWLPVARSMPSMNCQQPFG